MELLKQYQSHINVEWCCTSKAIKYLFKYITKGVDKAIIFFEKKGNELQERGDLNEEKVHVDEIHRYQECRYLSACEATWHIFAFDIHQQRPTVQKLILHLEGAQCVVFDESQSLEDVTLRPSISQTMFTEWMETNRHSPIARALTYAQFPTQFVWNSTDKIWSLRQKGSTIDRVVNIHPSAGDLYYLKILINHVKGAVSYESIRTFSNITHSTFKEACHARGLLSGDKEWHEAMQEASYRATAYQLREMFVMLLIYCDVSEPEKLWTSYWPLLGEDMAYKMRLKFSFNEYNLTEMEIQ